MLSPKDLGVGRSKNYSIELSFIDKIVAPEDNDEKYLGGYEIEHYHKGDDTALSQPMIRRKDSIVENIRKRIRQIEHNEHNRVPRTSVRRAYMQ